jgi:hypothetical protein
MAIIGEPQKVWELPAPLDIPQEHPDETQVPMEEPVKIEEPQKV